MRTAYPVIFTKSEDGWYLVDIPDMDRQTQGKDYPDAIFMARDLIGLYLTDLEDEDKEFPKPSALSDIDATRGEFADYGRGEVSMVDIDTTEYRRLLSAINKKSVRRNITLPAWLDYEAKKAKINVSKVLQEALTAKLGL